MKKILTLIFCLLCLVTLLAAATHSWRKLGTKLDGSVWYIDTSSIQKDDNIIHVFLKAEYPNILTLQGNKYNQIITYYKIDCDQQQQYWIIFQDLMLNETTVTVLGNFPAGFPVRLGSNEAKIISALCSGDL